MTVDELDEIECLYTGNPPDTNDCRVVFMNNICQLVWDKHEGRIDDMRSELMVLHDQAEENIRNVYELFQTDIPLIGLAYLQTHDPDNWGWTKEQHNLAIKYTFDAAYNLHNN